MSRFTSEWLQQRQDKQAAATAHNRLALAAGPTPARPRHEESQMQRSCVTWFRLQYPDLLLLSIPNGAHLAGTKKQRAMKASVLKAEGLVPGASDLVLIHPRGVLFLEAKTLKGRLSPEQRVFRDRVEAMGHRYEVFRSVDGFMELVRGTLSCAHPESREGGTPNPPDQTTD